jgi:hypothetical protein
LTQDYQLGPSALAGFSLFALMLPVQKRIMSGQFTIRRSSMQWTDKRARLLTEVLASMRIVKYFTYESPFLKRIFEIRRRELQGIRKASFHQASIMLHPSITTMTDPIPALNEPCACVRSSDPRGDDRVRGVLGNDDRVQRGDHLLITCAL